MQRILTRNVSDSTRLQLEQTSILLRSLGTNSVMAVMRERQLALRSHKQRWPFTKAIAYVGPEYFSTKCTNCSNALPPRSLFKNIPNAHGFIESRKTSNTYMYMRASLYLCPCTLSAWEEAEINAKVNDNQPNLSTPSPIFFSLSHSILPRFGSKTSAS